VPHVALDIPDALSSALAEPGQDLGRPIIEAAALEAYRERKISAAQLRELLGFATRDELDGFLNDRGVWIEYDIDDLARDRETHNILGL
jgi:hypothetical protein